VELFRKNETHESLVWTTPCDSKIKYFTDRNYMAPRVARTLDIQAITL
jgi:hypothetical protein